MVERESIRKCKERNGIYILVPLGSDQRMLAVERDKDQIDLRKRTIF